MTHYPNCDFVPLEVGDTYYIPDGTYHPGHTATVIETKGTCTVKVRCNCDAEWQFANTKEAYDEDA